MPNWKKVITSGSNAVLNEITASGAVNVLSLDTTNNLNVGGQARIYNKNLLIGTEVTASGFNSVFEFQAGPSTYSSQLIFRPTGNPGGYNTNYWGTIRWNPANEAGLTILAGNYKTNIVFGRGAPSVANPPAFAILNNDGLRIQSSYVQNIATAEEKLHVVGNGKFTGFVTASTYYGDGSNLTGIDSGSWDGIFTGSAIITGSLEISNTLFTTISSSVSTGTTTLYTFTNYEATHAEYKIKNGSNLRTGTVIGCWDGSSVDYTETSINGLGTTSDASFAFTSTGQFQITTSGTYEVKVTARAL